MRCSAIEIELLLLNCFFSTVLLNLCLHYSSKNEHIHTHTHSKQSVINHIPHDVCVLLLDLQKKEKIKKFMHEMINEISKGEIETIRRRYVAYIHKYKVSIYTNRISDDFVCGKEIILSSKYSWWWTWIKAKKSSASISKRDRAIHTAKQSQSLWHYYYYQAMKFGFWLNSAHCSVCD